MTYPYRMLQGHANQWYLFALQAIIDEGARVTTRGRTTWEILHALTKLPDPRRRVLTVPFRRANPFFQALETVWILAGHSDAAWLLHYNSQMAKYLDSYETGPGWAPGEIKQHGDFHGAYGERLIQWGRHARTGLRGRDPRNQVQDVIAQLRKEATSRRAVMTIHNPAIDNPDLETLDRPCNLAMTYQLRDGLLTAATFNRSNDLNLGLAFTNLCQFTTIQEFIGAALGVDPGIYTHFSSSLHVYDDDPIVQRLLRPLWKVRAPDEPVEIVVQPGAVAQLPSPEIVVPKFDVYDYVQPTPMAPWSGDSGWAAVVALDVVGNPESRAGSFLGLEREVSAIQCPYWRSLGYMALAWHSMKNLDRHPKGALVDALNYLAGVEAKDWQVACLEFVHRWACKRGEATLFKSSVLETKPFKELPGPVLEFVLHDEGADGSA